jgi:hypothetical protein
VRCSMIAGMDCDWQAGEVSRLLGRCPLTGLCRD